MPWLHAWSTHPFLDFDQPAFSSIDRETFFEIVTNTLAKYDRQGLSTHKFSLEVNVGGDASIVDKWLAVVLRNKVQELSLVTDPPDNRYLLPSFTSNSLTVLKLFRPLFVLNDKQFFLRGSLVVPHLPPIIMMSEEAWEGIEPETSHIVRVRSSRCPNLKKLVLWFVRVIDQTIQNLASSFPLLEELHLTDRVVLQKIYVANLIYLKIFSCSLRYYYWDEVRVEAPKLQSFSCSYYDTTSNGRFIIEPYYNLRSFSVFRSTSITDLGLCDPLSQCPLLEDLSLHSRYLLERILIASHSLKCLRLKLGSPLVRSLVVELLVDAPNLCSLEYHDYKLSYLSLVSPLVQAQAKSSIRAGYHENFDAKWFCKLGSLLKRFKTSDLTICASTPNTKEIS